MVEVSLDDLHSAFVAWIQYHQNPSKDIARERREFARFLDGAPLPTILGFTGTWELTEGQARRMHMLLGPHAHTIIKAYYAYEEATHDLHKNV